LGIGGELTQVAGVTEQFQTRLLLIQQKNMFVQTEFLHKSKVCLQAKQLARCLTYFTQKFEGGKPQAPFQNSRSDALHLVLLNLQPHQV